MCSLGTDQALGAHTEPQREQRGKEVLATLKEEDTSRTQVPTGPPTTPLHGGLPGPNSQQHVAGSCHVTLHFWDAWDACHSLQPLADSWPFLAQGLYLIPGQGAWLPCCRPETPPGSTWVSGCNRTSEGQASSSQSRGKYLATSSGRREGRSKRKRKLG